MALPASGALSIHDIVTEKGGSPVGGGNYSLTSLSTTDINGASSFKPDGIAPHGILEFYQYNHAEGTTTTTIEPTTTTTIEPTTTTTIEPTTTTSTTTTSTTTSTTTTTTVLTYDSIGTWGSTGDSSPGVACPPNAPQNAGDFLNTELFVVTGTPIQNGTTVYFFNGSTYVPFNGSGAYWGEVIFSDDVNTYIINGSGQLSGEYFC